jgi:hypothetical protein
MLKQQQLLNRPTPSGGVVPGVANPYQLALGGLTVGNIDGELQTYQTGGLHEQNPLGGIPIGIGQNGHPNLVEEGEAAFNFPDGKYIYSNRLTIDNVYDIGLPKSIKG